MHNKDLITDLTLPVIAAPMFLISGPDLVVECCKNGVVGTFPALNRRSSEEFEQWLIEIKSRLEEHERLTGKRPAPFGVNLIVHHSNSRVEDDLKLCVKHRVPLIITSLGIDPAVIDAVHGYGGLVLHDVIMRRHAKKAASAGVDGLILVATGAGGHAGTTNPMVLISEIKSFFNKTIILAGCISHGGDIASAMQMGADLAYMGTRFINTQESMASEEYRNMIIGAESADIIYTAAISGVKANFLRQSLEGMGVNREQWEQTAKMDFGKEAGDASAWKTIWSAGQGVSSITDVLPVDGLIKRLKLEFHRAIKRQYQLLETYPE